MTLIKVGSLVNLCNEKNEENKKLKFVGININKEFIPTVANVNSVDAIKYKIIKKDRFVFSGMQTGRDGCIRIGLYENDGEALISPAYTTFEVEENKVLPEYFFMIFNSKEKDRFGAFLSDSSIRSNLDWERFIEIELSLPPIEIQRKYVAIYKALKENLRVYESNLDDLKLTYEGYIENLRKTSSCEKIGKYIQEVNERNMNLQFTNVQGVDSSSRFVLTKANLQGVDLSKYKLVKEGCFAYNPSRINLGSIALKTNECCIISPMYEIFKIYDTNKLVPEYLFMWLTRKEFLRSTLFYAIGSVRDTFDLELMKQVSIPIPNIDIQKNIVQLYNSYTKRKVVIMKLKNIINEICPILVRGAIKESSEE